LVDSAGCGAQLKDYGHLLKTQEAKDFSARVLDVHEWLAEHLDELPPAPKGGVPVAVQDPCHLRHVQRSHKSVYEVLGRYTEAVTLDDEGLCCGAGGAYSAFHPDTAAEVRDRKVASIERSGAAIVASANPGCLLHLRSAGLDVRHPLEIIDSIMTKDV
jgi:glycolate oxidase iron-sulfur subunit